MRDYNHRKSSDKIWVQDGRLFLKKNVIFLSFSSVIVNFFSLIELTSFIDPLHQKQQKPKVCQKIVYAAERFSVNIFLTNTDIAGTKMSLESL